VTTQFLIAGPDAAPATILLAHGAGAPMDSAAMTALTDALVNVGLRVARFEFAYMAGRRTGAGKKPPPRADRLLGEYRAAIDDLAATGPLIIGGKSMGGRVATMVADDMCAQGKTNAVLGVGYPFHPPTNPDQLRTNHLIGLKTPTLICQGTRDPFGTRDEVQAYELSPQITIEWFEDGDHDLKPRKSVSGLTAKDHLTTLATTVRRWIDGL